MGRAGFNQLDQNIVKIKTSFKSRFKIRCDAVNLQIVQVHCVAHLVIRVIELVPYWRYWGRMWKVQTLPTQ